MSKHRILYIVFSVVIGLSTVIYLLLSGFDDTVVYYKTVDELLENPERFSTRPVRINGRLMPNSVRVKPNSNEYRFDLEKRRKTVTVAYEGILPDTMMEGQDIVVQGVFNKKDEVFVASEVLTKCPSKYEAEAAAIE